ncbi:MAG: amino acid--tRNA ligase-related protein, partial [Nanoarchaeota archaeon]|nr:amino acid--tRNA ligase-related protein [Nanoarchaeota archaeon]
MERTYVKDVFEAEGKVLLKGWVYDSRDLSKVRFLVLRDISGRVQVTGIKGKTSEDVFEIMDNIPKESVIEIIGIIKDSKQAPGGKEILPEKIEILAKSEFPLPIDTGDFSKTELPKRLDYRFLDLHREKTQAIFKIQHTMMQAFRKFMNNEGAYEFLFPGLMGSSSEGGTEVYKLKYFEKTAFLSQSCQLYKQMVACAMEKCYAVFPVWRAEKHNTVRHLNESRQFDYEQAFADDKVVMDVLARCVQFMVKQILELNEKELGVLGV